MKKEKKKKQQLSSQNDQIQRLDGWMDWTGANGELFINFKRLLPESLTPWKNNIKKDLNLYFWLVISCFSSVHSNSYTQCLLKQKQKSSHYMNNLDFAEIQLLVIIHLLNVWVRAPVITMFSVLWLLTAMVATMAIVHMMPWCVGDLCYALLTCEQKKTHNPY